MQPGDIQHSILLHSSPCTGQPQLGGKPSVVRVWGKLLCQGWVVLWYIARLYLVCISNTVLCSTVRALVSQSFSCFKRYKGGQGTKTAQTAEEGTTGLIVDLEEDGGRH